MEASSSLRCSAGPSSDAGGRILHHAVGPRVFNGVSAAFPIGRDRDIIELRHGRRRQAACRLAGGTRNADMEMRPAAFIAAAAVMAGAAGIGAYFAVRDNADSGAASGLEGQLAMAGTAGVAMPVDATEQVVEPATLEPEPEPAEPEPPPAPRAAERRATPPPPGATASPGAGIRTGNRCSNRNPSPARNRPKPPARPRRSRPTTTGPGASPEAAAPDPNRDAPDDLPRIDGWRRAERPADAAAFGSARLGDGRRSRAGCHRRRRLAGLPHGGSGRQFRHRRRRRRHRPSRFAGAARSAGGHGSRA